MTREEEIEKVLDDKFDTDLYDYKTDNSYCNYCAGFIQGVEWADENQPAHWIKFTEKFPPQQEPIIIAMKNKNKENGIWLYDLCMFFGGDYTDNNNWEEKVNWEIPIYWMPIQKLPKE